MSNLLSFKQTISIALVLLIISVGCYWNLGWPMAIPLLTLLWPALLVILVDCLIGPRHFVKKLMICVFSIVIVEVIRDSLYINYGHGMEYLLNDGETQLVVILIFMEQVVIMNIGLVVIAMIKRKKDRIVSSLSRSSLSRSDQESGN